MTLRETPAGWTGIRSFETAFVPRRARSTRNCHVFGPGAVFPYAPERKYTPCDASKEQCSRCATSSDSRAT